jgi:predicted DNA binding CopG/RHH family protein
MKDKVINIRLSSSDLKKLKEYSSKNGEIPISTLIRYIVMSYLEKQENASKTQNN